MPIVTATVAKYRRHRVALAEGVAAVGLISSVVSLFAPPWIATSIKYLLSALFVVLAILLIAIRRNGVIVFPEKRNRIYIQIPPDRSDVDAAISLARNEWRGTTIAPSVVVDAFIKNPYGIAIARTKDGDVVGFVDYYALAPAALKRLLDGKFREETLTSADLVDPTEPGMGKNLYVGGILVESESDIERGRIASSLLRAMIRSLVDNVATDDEDVTVYAVAHGPRALGILKRLDFGLADCKANRTRSPNLYVRHATRRNLKQLLLLKLAHDREGIVIKHRKRNPGETARVPSRELDPDPQQPTPQAA